MAIGKVEICGMDTSQLPVLTADEMNKLMKRSKDGDLEARNEMIRGNLRLVLSVIQKFQNRQENVDDLFQVGCIGLMKALSKEVGPSGIRVNAVTPGVIRTDMLNSFDDEAMKALADETPLGRIGTPGDVAKAIRFLLSDDASFITGQTLGVNGGFGM